MTRIVEHTSSRDPDTTTLAISTLSKHHVEARGTLITTSVVEVGPSTDAGSSGTSAA